MNTVKEARKALQLTQAEFAEKTGLCHNTIVKAEQGERINEDCAEIIAQTLGGSVADYFKPTQISNRGRRPRTGKPIGSSNHDDAMVICNQCFIMHRQSAACGCPE